MRSNIGTKKKGKYRNTKNCANFFVGNLDKKSFDKNGPNTMRFSMLLAHVRQSFVWSYLQLSEKLSNGTDTDLLEPPALSTPKITLMIGNDEVLTCHLEYFVKMSAENR